MQDVIYGAAPLEVGEHELDFQEFMHYLYLPVVMPGMRRVRLPTNLHFLRPIVEKVCALEMVDINDSGWGERKYVYVTAKHGFASPGAPLNRPGWHADGFGSQDVNYIWSDRWPTRFALGELSGVSDDHVASAVQFDAWANGEDLDPRLEGGPAAIEEGLPNMLYRLDPTVVHATPIIPAPGGERSFLKVSVSDKKYNLRGNSRNHQFKYEWKMWARDELRNDPAFAGGDFMPET